MQSIASPGPGLPPHALVCAERADGHVSSTFCLLPWASWTMAALRGRAAKDARAAKDGER